MMISLMQYLIVLKDKISIIGLEFSWQLIEVMHLSIVCPTLPPGAVGKERWR